MAIAWWRSLKSIVSHWPGPVVYSVLLYGSVNCCGDNCENTSGKHFFPSVSECINLFLNWKSYRFSNVERLTAELAFTRLRCSVLKINGWWGVMPLSTFQYICIPVLLCILPGLGLFTLGKAWAGLNHSLLSLSGHQENGARLFSGYLMAGQDTRGVAGADGIQVGHGTAALWMRAVGRWNRFVILWAGGGPLRTCFILW